jgi:hypothetical protein
MTPVIGQWGAGIAGWGASAALRRLGAALLAAVAAILVIGVGYAALFAGNTTDFTSFYESARAVAHGSSPYPSLASLPPIADRHTFAPFVYPPVIAFLFVPLTLLPLAAAKFVFFSLGLAAVAAGLRLLDVRDATCYAAAFASLPVLEAAGVGSVSPLLFFAVAAAWRYRDHTLAVALSVAAVVVAKLFLWPLVLWLVYTRRYAAAVLSAAIGALVLVAAWGAIGFAGLAEYPQLLSRLTDLTGVNSFSLYAFERALGLSSGPAQIGVAAVGCAAVCVAAPAVRSPRGDSAAFTLAVGLALLFTPILWPHYLVLLLAPIAIVRPKMSALWLLPLLFWLGGVWSFANPARILPTLLVAAALLIASTRFARLPKVG